MDPRLEASLIAHRVVLAYLVHITGARHSQSPGGIPALAETMLATSLVRLIAAHGPDETLSTMTAASREMNSHLYVPGRLATTRDGRSKPETDC